MSRRLLALSTALAALSAAACLSPEPRRETVVLRTPSEKIPAYIREVVDGKTVGLHVPHDMRGVAIDFLRAAGATVIEGGSAELYLEGSSRIETLPPPPGLTTSQALTVRYVTVDLELKAPRPDHSKAIVFRGRGQAPDRGNSGSAVATAGARALMNLH